MLDVLVTLLEFRNPLYRKNVPLLHTSRYIIALDQFYQAFPKLIPQATNAGVRRPGYEAGVRRPGYEVPHDHMPCKYLLWYLISL